MTRPHIVRADTIDLQDHHAPSAKDHLRLQTQEANLAPHQAETLREVAHEAAEEQARSPRLSWNDGHGDPYDSSAEDLAAGVSSSSKMAQQQQQQQQQDEQEDALAIAQNGGVSSSDEGDMDGSGDDLDDDMMDRISSSPSIEDEDIDFEFVYALHTFVATVEGQANATKGDTMSLLDDSNSYWWLVRVVKDSSIGYLPAEHIETPTERLARLNKHRNVDLSASMLGDQAAKQKSTFKSIRKRRKTVAFAEPTYVDYSDINYSSDEDDIEELLGQDAAAQQQQDQQQSQQQQSEEKQQKPQQAADDDAITEEAAKVEPLKMRSAKDAKSVETGKEADDDNEETRDSEEILDGRTESKSRNGTVRNTDSFYKDESVETKKISLTPMMLRDDETPRQSTESAAAKDAKARASLDKMDKELVSDKDKKKAKEKEKREKEKKPSAIRNFFSRKDKRRASEDDDDSFGKRSMDAPSEPRDSEEPVSVEQSPDKQPVRSPSKLQKQQPRIEPSANRKNSVGQSQKKGTSELVSFLSEGRTNDVSDVPPASMRIVDPDTKETQEIPSNQQPSTDAAQQERSSSAAALRSDRGALAKSLLPRSASAASNNVSAAPQKAVQAKARMELDDSDSSEAEEALLRQPPQLDAPSRPPPERPVPAPLNLERPQDKAMRPQLPGAFPDSYLTTATASSTQTVTPYHDQGQQQVDRERLSESPIEVSPMSPVDPSKPPELLADSAPNSPSLDYSPSPELVQADEAAPKEQQAPPPKWDDVKLRAFFDQSEYVRDLLTVVYDTSDADASTVESPAMNGVFREQNARLAEMTTQLDNMLGDWLARKQRTRGSL